MFGTRSVILRREPFFNSFFIISFLVKKFKRLIWAKLDSDLPRSRSPRLDHRWISPQISGLRIVTSLQSQLRDSVLGPVC